jgi:hypothetical protein
VPKKTTLIGWVATSHLDDIVVYGIDDLVKKSHMLLLGHCYKSSHTDHHLPLPTKIPQLLSLARDE